MARRPDGTLEDVDAGEPSAADAEELVFARALERIIDGALARHPPGGRFVYGIHQAITPATIDLLTRRYRDAGWSRAEIREGATGAFLLVLHP
jgi:hypothetical protein